MTFPAHPFRLIGFDAREEIALSKASWTAVRKADFLLRDDIDCPLSVDQGAWPSVLADPGSDGLSNCGYSPAEREAWRSRWGGRVNAVHLFDDAREAHSFATETNQRVPEHAPFFVYGLFVRLPGD